MSKSKIDKQKAKQLLEKQFPGFTVTARRPSNNGDPFLVYKDIEKFFIKVLNTESLEEEGLDEIAALKKVKSDHVVELLDSGTLYDSYVFLKFPFIDGTTLDKIPTSEFDESEIRKLLEDIGTGISDLSKAGVIHRDIKPKNIIRNSRGKFLLLDLGIGFILGEQDRDTAKERGSRKYSSPEQFLSAEEEDIDISFASDLFSLGVIAYECATGNHPFEKFDKRKFATVAAAICKMPLPALASVKGGISESLTTLIDRMLAKNQSKRFSTPQQYIDTLQGKPHKAKRNLEVYIYNPEPFDAFKKYYQGASIQEKVDGVLLKVTATEKRIKQFRDLGVEVLVDPLTYLLPYRHKANSPQISLRRALAVKSEADLSGMAINDDAFLKKLIRKSVDKQKDLNKIILPYFAMRADNDELIKVTTKIWRFHQAYTRGLKAEIYGGLVIPEAVLISAKKRARFLDRFMGGYGLDGMYITFQNEDDSVYITNNETKLLAITEIINHFAEQGNVIIGKCDPSIVPLLATGIIVTSGNKSERHLSYAKLDNPKKQDGSPKPEDISLRYFCDQLYDFLQEKPFLEGTRRFGIENKVSCSCDHCKVADIFNTATSVSNGMHTLMRSHYYTKISSYVHSANGQGIDDYKKSVIIKLKAAAMLGDEITKLYPGSKGLPDHEGLIAAINKS
jgi:serine/threonine protein kinase